MVPMTIKGLIQIYFSYAVEVLHRIILKLRGHLQTYFCTFNVILALAENPFPLLNVTIFNKKVGSCIHF